MTYRVRPLLLAGLALFLGLAPVHAMKDWTVLVYMVGDDDGDRPIEDNQIDDLLELDSVGSNAQVDLIVQMDRGPKLTRKMKQYYGDPNYSGGIRYHVRDGKWVTEEKLGEVNCGDPMVLYEALRWAAEKHPARRYALVINAHGSGVLTWNGTGSVGSETPGAVDFPYGPGAAPMTGYDSTDKDSLSAFELARVLGGFKERLNRGRPLDVIGFDSCYSGMLEVVYQLRDVVGTVVASPTTVPGSGFAYAGFSRRLVRNPAMDGRQLAKDMVETFIDTVGSNGKSDVLGAWDTAGAEDMMRALSSLTVELMRARKAGAKLSFQSQSKFSDRYWDVGKFCRSIEAGNTGVAGATNFAAIQRAAAELEAARRASMVSLWYDGDFAEAKVGGLALYWPEADEYRKYRAFYKALDASRAGFWDEFLDMRELGQDFDLGEM